MNGIFRAGLAALCLAGAAIAAYASETVTYTYDALGRLTKVERAGTVNNNVSANYSYDKADNRTNVTVASPNPPPPGEPPPPGGNQPPVAVNDTGSMTRCVAKTFAVLANDIDPDGNTPLALVSVSGGGIRGTPSISGTSILFEPNDISGIATVTYVVRDSLGATASATLTITITDGSCDPPQLVAPPAPEGE